MDSEVTGRWLRLPTHDAHTRQRSTAQDRVFSTRSSKYYACSPFLPLCEANVVNSLHIGVAGPCSPRLFARDLGRAKDLLPVGMGGTPVNHLVRAWLDAGHRVTLATLDRHHEDSVPAVFRGERLTLTVGQYRARHRARNAFLQERQGVAAGLNLGNPDVVTAHWSYEFALGAISTGLPTMVTVRDVPRVVFRMQPIPYRMVRWGMHRVVMRKATKLAFNSPYTQLALRHPRARAGVVLPNAVPDSSFRLSRRPLPDVHALRVISVNHGFSRRKNVGALLEAFALVSRQLPGVRLTLVGDGFEQGGAAETWAKARGLEQGVSFAGALVHDEVLRRIEASDVLVHPSLEESFGYTLIEAMSVGTPVIAGRTSGAAPWVVADGTAGLLVDVSTPESIATAIVTLCTSAERWQQLRERAFAMVRARFSASSVAAAYVRELEAIAR